MKKFRIGFIVDELTVNYYVGQLISFVANDETFEEPVLITGYKKKIKKKIYQKFREIILQRPLKVIDSLLKILFYKLIFKIEAPRIKKIFPNYFKKVDLSLNQNLNILNVVGEWNKSGKILNFNDKDLLKIKEKDFDCLIRCGSGILKGKILNITKLGIISFHHGDNRVNRGGPSGFWEVLNSEPSSGFIIQKINDELDGGEVLLRGNMMTQGTWFINRAQLFEKSNFFLMKLIKNLSFSRKLPKYEELSLHGNKLYKIDSSIVLLKYILKIYIPKLYNRMLNIFLHPKKIFWSVAYGRHNNYSKSLWRYTEVKNPRSRYLADPFVFQHNETNFIFVEDFSLTDNKGRISAIKISNESHEFLGTVLEEDFHLSFPFVFCHDNEIYMIPESGKNRDIRLYKCQKFPDKWKLEMIMMSNVSAADTMVLFQNKKWFMLTNICSANIGDHQSELHIFFSENLKSDTWQPVKSGNPVIFDSLKSRNGGLFFNKGQIYRVNQIHGQKHYGKSFGINRIKNISEDNYEEERISKVNANYKDGIISTHGFSANENIAAVDFARLMRLKIQ